MNSEMLILGADSLEIIESYPHDKYLPSFIVRGEMDGNVFHAQIATGVWPEHPRPDNVHSIGRRLECRFSLECGGQITDLPFKTGSSIVIVKALPVLQCGLCSDMELEPETMVAVEALLSRVSASAELSVLPFAA